MVFLFIPKASANFDFDLYKVIGYEVFSISKKLSHKIVAHKNKKSTFLFNVYHIKIVISYL
jgi:hypothetical protein